MGFRFDGRTRAGFLSISVLLSGQEPERALRPQQANASPAVQEARIALVIGNGAYRDAPLKNPVNDARAMAGALGALGFQVIALEDASLQKMREGLREFGSRIAKGGVGLFYYAGHGMQVKGRNYLIPVGADIATEDEVTGEAVEVDGVRRNEEGHVERAPLDVVPMPVGDQANLVLAKPLASPHFVIAAVRHARTKVQLDRKRTRLNVVSRRVSPVFDRGKPLTGR